jgi:type IV fimbrial biogenesis protein FimT
VKLDLRRASRYFRVRYPPAGAGERHKPQRGFTLVELMIGVLLVSVLLGIGLPLFRSFILEQRLRATTADLRIALTLARSEAVKRNRVVEMLPCATGWSKGWAIPIPPGPVDDVIPCPPDPDNPVPAILTHIQTGDVTITTDPADETPQFSPAGRAVAEIAFEVDVDPASSDKLACLRLETDGRLDSDTGACP